jgi:nucleoside-diphosphate-sugar epimerase
MAKKILLVTGAGGFLGTEITRLAQTAGWQVRGFDRAAENLPDDVEKIKGDIGDAEALERACLDADALIHAAGLAHVFGAAAKDEERFRLVNEVGTQQVFAAAFRQGVRRMVHVSSVSVYGDYDGVLCTEENPCQPQGAYAVSKWRAELRAQEQIDPYQASLTILRFSTMYGEGDRGNVGRLIRAVKRGRFIWPGAGSNRKSLIFREDAARACLRALEGTNPGIGIYNVSAPAESLRSIVEGISTALNMSVPRLGLPQWILDASLKMAGMLHLQGTPIKMLTKIVHDDCYDASRFNNEYGYRTQIELAEGLRRAVAHLRE